MIKVIIVDDEVAGQNLISEYLQDYEHLEIIGRAYDGRAAVKLIDKLKPDLVFLDVNMPVFDGLKVIEKSFHLPRIIFSTAYDKYAIKAFEIQAIDYLLKPYTKKRFDQALSRINISKTTPSLSTDFNSLLVTTTKGLARISLDGLIFVAAYGDYVKMYTNEGVFVCNHGIGYWEKRLLSTKFFRIHRSTIINMECLKIIETVNRRNWALLFDGTRLPVSRSKYAQLKNIKE